MQLSIRNFAFHNKLPFIITIFLGALIYLSILSFVGKSLYGNMDWLVFPSELFGVPNYLEKDLGFEPLFKEASGWDGQFYYYISNDVFALNEDTAKHIDAPIYRWQRIGLPLLANGISAALGQQYVLVSTFIFTSVLIYILAIYCFSSYLHEKKYSVLFVLPWALSIGVYITLLHGLPDAIADSFFILSFIALLKRKYWIYAACITLASLSRESYILLAFMVFIFSFFGVIEKKNKFKIKSNILFALPGVIYIAAWLYIRYKFIDIYPDSTSLTVIQNGIMHFPLWEWGKHVLIAIGAIFKGESLPHGSPYSEFFYLISYIVTLCLIFFLSYKVGKKKKLFYIFIPYVLLVATFGHTVMFHYSGYMKGISILFAILIFLLIEYNKKRLTQILILPLIGYLILNIYHYQRDKIPLRVSLNNQIKLIDNAKGKPLTNFNAKIKIKSKGEKNKFSKMPLENLFLQEYQSYIMHVKNTSNAIWYKEGDKKGRYYVALAYQFFKADDMNKIVMEGGRYGLPHNLFPGQAADVNMTITYPKETGHYVLRIGLIQEGVSWFYTHNKGYVDVPLVLE